MGGVAGARLFGFSALTSHVTPEALSVDHQARAGRRRPPLHACLTCAVRARARQAIVWCKQ
ncbi:MAG: hypothetical protein ACK4ZJ_16410, partial [Allorhizobium sp.]